MRSHSQLLCPLNNTTVSHPPANSSFPTNIPELTSLVASTSTTPSEQPSSPVQEQPTPTSTSMVTPIAPLSHQQNGHSMVTRSKSGIFKKKVCLSTKHQVNIPSTDYLDSIEPANFTEASKYPAWHQAMSEEFSALQRQGTWTLVPFSPDKHVVG